jgi:hypothetical protein
MSTMPQGGKRRPVSERLRAWRLALVLFNLVVVAGAIAVIALLDLSALWAVGAALVSGGFSLTAAGASSRFDFPDAPPVPAPPNLPPPPAGPAPAA